MKILLIKLKLYFQSVIKKTAKQDILALSFLVMLFFLTACQKHNLAPREIEIPNNNLLPYKTKNKYIKAINKISSAVMGIGIHNATPLSLTISGSARSLIDSRYFFFSKRKIKIEHNTCKTILLASENYQNAVPLQICYINKNLYLDPDPYNKENIYLSSIFYPSVLWRIGAELHGIDTHGIASIKNAKMKIKILS